MTFLRLAPFTKPCGDETRHKMLSEMTSTVSSTSLALTIGCAQCQSPNEIQSLSDHNKGHWFSSLTNPDAINIGQCRR
ncbi:MAG: hypothetical protein M2R45_02919 [Verrucomicrobia subdivision 3 bacterium]|nr:hypothetical protein [Limisphaerales bacterium]MCS1415359.1 hypothetical protein [Limisphaerales bacterium]